MRLDKYSKYRGAYDLTFLIAADILNRILIQIFVSTLARKVELDVLAYLTLAQGIASFSLQYSEGSLNPLALKRVEKQYEKSKFAEIIQLKVLVTLIYAALASMVILVIAFNFIWYFVIASVTPVLTCYNLQFIQQMKNQISKIALSRIAVGVVTSMSGIMMLQVDIGSSYFLYLLPYAIGTTCFVLLSFNPGSLKEVLSSFTRPQFKGLINLCRISYQLGLFALVLQMFQFVPLLFAPSFGQHALEALGLSTRVWFILAIPISMFSVVLLPRMMKGEIVLRNWIIWVNLFYLVLFGVSIFIGRTVLGILYGSQSQDYFKEVFLFCIAIPVWATSNLIINFLISKGEFKGLVLGPVLSVSLLSVLLALLHRETDLYSAWFVANSMLLMFLIHKMHRVSIRSMDYISNSETYISESRIR